MRRGDHLVSMPVAAVLERPQHTPLLAPLIVSVERLAWDSLAVDLGESSADGIVGPGTEVPVSIGFNILWPDCGEVNVHATAALRPARGGDVIWHSEQTSVLATNRRELAVQQLELDSTARRGDLRAGSSRDVGAERRPRRLATWAAHPSAQTSGGDDLGHPPRGVDGDRSPGTIGRGDSDRYGTWPRNGGRRD